MRTSSLSILTLASVVLAIPQASANGAVAPKDGPPPNCQTSYDGNFGLSVVELGKRSLDSRGVCDQQGALDLTLKNSVLTDSKGRTGSIVANYQFQFDGPPQAGFIYSSGFSVCPNGTLALGGSATFYRCLSGDFYNIYDRYWAQQCSPIQMSVLPCNGGFLPPAGQDVVGTVEVQTAVIQVIGDGQPQVIPTVIPIPICQINDGQIQGHTTPCGAIATPTITITKSPSPPASGTAPPNVPPPPASTQVPGTTPGAPLPSGQPGQSKTTSPAPPASTSAPTRPANTTSGRPSATTRAAPPVAGGQRLIPAPSMALAAVLVAALYMI